MSTVTLKRSAVEFDSAGHTYRLGDRYLKGVTGIVKWVYPETYSDIPEEVLRKAAERGTSVHLDCQMADAGMGAGSREAAAYQELLSAHGLTPLTSEWLVDDGHAIASSIDKIFTDYSIGDIKATSKIHKANVTLQLSIYAFMLECMNPGLEVPAIYVIWLPREIYGQPALMKLDRIPSGIVEEVMRSYLNGEPNAHARALLGADAPSVAPGDLCALQDEYIMLEATSRDVKSRMDEIKGILLERMAESGEKKYDWERMTVSYIAEKTSSKLDSAKLKREHADIYEACCKTETSKPYVQIKIKKNG